jgi:16S rRNA (adenine1518-N6/adenine1519-N6)-dimethyltransferase
VFRAKKSLGQNFLVDQNIIKRILETTDIEDKEILEVGPGTGNLTSEILKKKTKKAISNRKGQQTSRIFRKSIW